MSDMLSRYTFDNYEIPDEARASIKGKAKAFVRDETGWFFLFGRSGSGKTHICTAICKAFIERGMDTYYMAPERLMYAHLLEVAMQEKYAESDLLGYFAEAYFTAVDETNHQMTGYCYVRQAWIVPQSVGGSTAGFSIPFTVNPQGGMEKKAITYDMVTNTATVTALS